MSLFDDDKLRASFPAMYENTLVEPLFRPFAEAIISTLDLKPGDRVLDIACGTGIVSRLAKAQLGADSIVVGVDLSEPMLQVARAVVPTVEFRHGSAGALPVSDTEQFTIVTCHQGLQFFPDKPAAAREMRRVSAPGARLAVATWLPTEDIAFVRDLHAIAVQHLGPVVDARHGFGDATALGALLTGAGFRNVHVATITRTLRFPDSLSFARMNAMALIGMSPGASSYDNTRRDELAAAIVKDSRDVLANYATGDGLVFDIGTTLATATS